jgi:hypothetical protein
LIIGAYYNKEVEKGQVVLSFHVGREGEVGALSRRELFLSVLNQQVFINVHQLQQLLPPLSTAQYLISMESFQSIFDKDFSEHFVWRCRAAKYCTK